MKEHKAEPNKDEDLKVGIFLLGTRQDYTKSEVVGRG